MSLTDHGSAAVRSCSLAAVDAVGRGRDPDRRLAQQPQQALDVVRAGTCVTGALAHGVQHRGPAGGRSRPRNRGATGVEAGSTVQSTRTDRDPDRGRPRVAAALEGPPDDPDRPACHRPSASRREALHLRLGWRPCRGRRDDARPARRQGRGSGRDDQRRPAGPARLHHHDRGLQRLLHGRRAAARRPVGRRPGGGQGGRGADRQGLRRCRRSAARVGPLRGQVLDARDDGHGPQPRPQRGDPPRARRPDRQRALRLGCLPTLHPDVRADRHGREGRALRQRARGGQARPRRRAGHRPGRRRPPDARRGVQGASSARTPAATSRATRTSSSTSRSRPSSRAGSASAPSTTATTRRSPTTSAPRSTS